MLGGPRHSAGGIPEQVEVRNPVMRCPTLNELPPPPGKTGWPWTEESPQLPDTVPDGRPWPRVSIVTPSYNQAQFIEETIRSVLLQGYPNLEYIVIDGGSTDGSVDIIRRYEHWLAYWVSELDRGQSHAINKGWARARGDILAWLNSDDFYQPGAVQAAVRYLLDHPDVSMVYSDNFRCDVFGRPLGVYRSGPFDLRIALSGKGVHISQPTTFIRREILERIGPVEESLHLAMDADLFFRIASVGKLGYIPNRVLATGRIHQSAKTWALALRYANEAIEVKQRLFAQPGLPQEIAQLADVAYAQAHFSRSHTYSRAGEIRQAAKHLWQSFRLKPMVVLGRLPETALILLRIVAGPRGVRVLRRVKWTVTARLGKRWPVVDSHSGAEIRVPRTRDNTRQ